MRKTLIVLGLVASVSIAGCSSDNAGSAANNAGDTTAAKTKTASTTQPQFVANTQNTPGTLKDFVGAKSDAHDTSCKADGSKWGATGKVTNSSKKPAHYRIYVSFLEGDTTVGLSQSDFAPVAPRATHAWSGSVKTSGKDLRCILRVERADA